MPTSDFADAAPQYSPAGLPTLSEAARDLSSGALDDLALIAEQLLGLRGTNLTGTAGRTARLAVGMQVSFMVEQGVASRLYDRVTEGERSYTFAEAAQSGVDPVAASLVAPLLGPVPAPEPLPGFTLVRSL